jgi:predicted transcriptional regulator
MSKGGQSGRYFGMGQAVAQVQVGFIRMEEFAEDGIVAGNEFRAVVKVLNKHIMNDLKI